jgi:hypothetical protein
MLRDRAFVAAVQTGMQCFMALKLRVCNDDGGCEYARRAVDGVVLAASLPEHAIPQDVATAAKEFVEWQLDRPDHEGPPWYEGWRDVEKRLAALDDGTKNL